MESQQTVIDVIEEKVKAQRELPRALMNLDEDMNEDVLLGLREVPNKKAPSGEDYTSVSDPYFTTSGNTPVIHDQAYQNDVKGTVQDDFYNSDDWDVQNAEARYDAIINQYRKDQKAKRNAQFHNCMVWLKENHSKLQLVHARQVFTDKLQASRQHCAESKDWSTVYMTKDQANKIKEAFRQAIANSK